MTSGDCSDTIQRPLKRSHGHATALHSSNNMCLNILNKAEADFAKWQLDVGQGKHTDDACNITLPDHFKCRENNVASLIDSIYPGVDTPNHPNLLLFRAHHPLLQK